MDEARKKEIRREFADAVNMPPKALERWLVSEESKSVGQKDGGQESVGHGMGRRILELKATRVADLTDDDYGAMQKVHGYVARHLKQGPDDPADVETSRWRYSLMNWGHDPLKD